MFTLISFVYCTSYWSASLTYKFVMESVNLGKFMARRSDVLADKLRDPQFLGKILSKEMRHIRWCLGQLFLTDAKLETGNLTL